MTPEYKFKIGDIVRLRAGSLYVINNMEGNCPIIGTMKWGQDGLFIDRERHDMDIVQCYGDIYDLARVKELEAEVERLKAELVAKPSQPEQLTLTPVEQLAMRIWVTAKDGTNVATCFDNADTFFRHLQRRREAGK